MNKKNFLIITSSVVVLGALLAGVFFSGVLEFTKSTSAKMSLQGDMGTDGSSMESIYGSLNDAIRTSSAGWSAEMRGDHIALMDASSGSQVARIQKVSDNQITITSVVASLGALPAEQIQNVKRQISDFNMSSSVGTMELLPNGDVTMKHNLDPQRNAPEQIAKVAVTFGDKTRQQAQKYSSFKVVNS